MMHRILAISFMLWYDIPVNSGWKRREGGKNNGRRAPARKERNVLCCFNYRDENGKRKTPWISTNLPVKGNKKRAENFMMDVRRNFVPPNVQRIEEREAMQKGDILFTDFLLKWLRVAKSTIKLTTYASYEMMATRIIIPYFETLNIKLKELTTEDIQEFYSTQLERFLPTQ